MKTPWFVALFVLLVFMAHDAFGQVSKPLTDLKPVLSMTVIDEPFSLGGRVMHFGLQPQHTSDHIAVYDLGGKYSRFEAWIGLGDNQNANTKNIKCSITLDGKTVFDNQDQPFSATDPPVHVDLDVTGVQAIKIVGDLWVAIGEPTLYRAAARNVIPNSVPNATIQPSHVAILTSPENGVQLTQNSVDLSWSPVPGATKYGVEVVCTKGSSAGIYALNVNGGTSHCDFDLSALPNGEYHWSIIAFDQAGTIGKFSKDRTFVVAK